MFFFSTPPGYIKKQFTCKTCDKTFHDSQKYQKHIKNAHNTEGNSKENEEKLFCDQCGRDFVSRIGWLTHYKFKHPEILNPELQQNGSEKSFMCEQCSRFFETDKKLRRHISYFIFIFNQIKESFRIYDENNK